MSLTFHFHPLSSYCHKVLVGLYELDLDVEKVLVDFSSEASRNAFFALSPLGKMPVLRDDAHDRTLIESSVMLEYADTRLAKTPKLFPRDADRALEARLQDRFFDLYVHLPMQKVVNDRLRAEGTRDPFGVDEAKAQLRKAYGIADTLLAGRTWAAGEDFTVADCSAAAPLFFANKLVPFAEHRHLAAYFGRLLERPSYARVLEEAKPYLQMFPG